MLNLITGISNAATGYIIICVLFSATIGAYITHIVYRYQLKLSQKPNKPEGFRLEIMEVNEDKMSITLEMPKAMQGGRLGLCLYQSISALEKQDPVFTRILLLQTMEVLHKSPDIKEALANFDGTGNIYLN